MLSESTEVRPMRSYESKCNQIFAKDVPSILINIFVCLNLVIINILIGMMNRNHFMEGYTCKPAENNAFVNDFL